MIPPLCANCGGRTDGKVSAPSMAGFGALISCECKTVAPPSPRVLCPSGTRGCGQIAAAPGRWWYCSPECIARNKERP